MADSKKLRAQITTRETGGASVEWTIYEDYDGSLLVQCEDAISVVPVDPNTVEVRTRYGHG